MHAGLYIELHADSRPGESATCSVEAQVVTAAYAGSVCQLKLEDQNHAHSHDSICLQVLLPGFYLLRERTFYSTSTMVSDSRGQEQKGEEACDLSYMLSAMSGHGRASVC